MLFKVIVKRIIEFGLSVTGAIFAISTYISLSVLGSSLHDLDSESHWISSLRPAVILAAIVYLFYVVEKYLWPTETNKPVFQRKGVKKVIITASVLVVVGVVVLVVLMIFLIFWFLKSYLHTVSI